MSKFLLFITTILLLSGCYTRNQAIRKFCRADSTTATVMVTIEDSVDVPADSASVDINCQTLQELYDSLIKAQAHANDAEFDSMAVMHSSGNIDILVKPKQGGGFTFKARSNEHKAPFKKEMPVTVTVPCNCPPCPQPTTWQKVLMWAEHGLAFIGLLALLYLSFRLLKRT